MARPKKVNTEEVVVTVTTEEVTLPIAENPEAGQQPSEIVYDAPATLETNPSIIAAEIDHMNTDCDLSLVTPEQLGEVLEALGIPATEEPATDAPEVATAATGITEDTPEEDLNELFADMVLASVPATAPQPEVSGGTITVNDLAAEFGIEPKSLRSRLRKNGYKKAGKTWGWSPDSAELAEIRTKFSKKATTDAGITAN